MPVATQAQFNFITNNGSLTLTGYTGHGQTVVIPAMTNGYPVTDIGTNAFAQGFGYETVNLTIPDTVTNIDSYAFFANDSLTTINFGNGLKTIGYYAFRSCYALKTLNLPDSVIIIGTNAFSGCQLSQVAIGSGCVSIEDYAFVGNPVSEIIFGNNLTSIGKYAFQNCSLTNVVFGTGITDVGAYAFGNEESANFYFSAPPPDIETNTFANDKNSIVYYVPGTSGWGTNFGGLPTAPWTITGTFQGYINPPTVIADGAQWRVDNGPWQTNGAVVSNLLVGTHTLQSTIITGWYNVPYATKYIGTNSITTNDFGYVLEYNYTTSNSSVTITKYIATNAIVTIPDTIGGEPVTSIGDSAFQSPANLLNVIMGNNVTNIGDYAFSNPFNLTNVVIGNNVISIGNYAFFNDRITNITIPNNVTSIGDYAFSGSSLINLTLGSNIMNIGFSALMCSHLTNISVNPLNSFYSSFNGALYNNHQTVLIQYPQGNTATTFYVPDTVTNIADYALVECSSLENIYFSSNAPGADSSTFFEDNAILYYLPGTTGWSSPFNGLPAVSWNPQAQNDTDFGMQTNQFGFDIVGSTNIVVVVQTCTNLANPVWIPIQTNTLTTGSAYFSDSQSTNYPNRYYRFSSP